MGRTRKNAKAEVGVFHDWKSLYFWRNLAFYFLFFSYIGHYIEIFWTSLGHIVLGTELHTNILANPLEPYTIYGTGAVLCILLVEPIAKKFKDNVFATFIAATVVCSTLELVSSIFLTMRYGVNPYWDYHERVFNLYGHICLGNCLLFGLLGTLFLRFIYSPMEKLLKKTNQALINTALIVLIIMLAAYYLGVF